MSGRRGQSDFNKTSMELTLKTTETNTKKPKATIYVTIDTSGSMSGSKINQVIDSLVEIIENAPYFVRFTIRYFNTKVETIVTKKKGYLDLLKLRQSIIQNVKGQTALYDAWQQTLDQINNSDKGLDKVYVLIFTDGEDNVSKATLPQVLESTKKNITGNRYFTFIQAGPMSDASRAIDNRKISARCRVINVEDSVTGIKFAFNQYKEFIKVQFTISISAGSSQMNNLSLQLNASNLGETRANIVTQNLPQIRQAHRSTTSIKAIKAPPGPLNRKF